MKDMLRVDKESLKNYGNEIYLHDCIMVSMKQNFEEHRLEVVFENHYTGFMKRYTITFVDALYFELSNFSPWISGHRVSDMSFVESTLFDRLLALPDEWGTRDRTNLPESNEDFIQPQIQFLSGDRMRILCKAIEVEEAPL